jgi:hypothetical protein
MRMRATRRRIGFPGRRSLGWLGRLPVRAALRGFTSESARVAGRRVRTRRQAVRSQRRRSHHRARHGSLSRARRPPTSAGRDRVRPAAAAAAAHRPRQRRARRRRRALPARAESMPIVACTAARRSVIATPRRRSHERPSAELRERRPRTHNPPRRLTCRLPGRGQARGAGRCARTIPLPRSACPHPLHRRRTRSSGARTTRRALASPGRHGGHASDRGLAVGAGG